MFKGNIKVFNKQIEWDSCPAKSCQEHSEISLNRLFAVGRLYRYLQGHKMGGLEYSVVDVRTVL